MLKKISESPELNKLEFILLNLIVDRLYTIEYSVNKAAELLRDNKFQEAKEQVDKLYLLRYNNGLSELKKAFFDAAEPKTLSKIVNEEKFSGTSSYSEPFLIPKEVLMEFSSYDRVAASNLKASIARKLGAVIVA